MTLELRLGVMMPRRYTSDEVSAVVPRIAGLLRAARFGRPFLRRAEAISLEWIGTGRDVLLVLDVCEGLPRVPIE